MRVLVCGSREFRNGNMLYQVLNDIRRYINEILEDEITIIEGTCRGADRIAGEWAGEKGIDCLEFPAQWDKYGRRAGYLRNQQMLDEGHPDLVVAFQLPGSRGTAMMVDLALKAGVETIVIHCS